MAPKRYSFTSDNLDKAPNKGGVYALYRGEELVYIGRAKGGETTIQSRLKDHFSGREGPGTQMATTYSRQVTTRPVTREKELLKSFEKTFGTLPRYNQRLG